MEAYDRLAGDGGKRDNLSASNAAEAATTLAAVADMLLKTGQVEEAADSLATSLDLLKQHPGQLPALQVLLSPPVTALLMQAVVTSSHDLPCI